MPSPLGGAGSYGMSERDFKGSIGRGDRNDRGSSDRHEKPSKPAKDPFAGGFKVDTPENTQVTSHGIYSKDDRGTWRDSATGEVASKSERSVIDRQIAELRGSAKTSPASYGILDSVKSFFSSLNPFDDDKGDVSKATKGISPLGGWASYGGALPQVEDTRGFFDRLGESFQKFGWGLKDAPLSTLANAMSNPMVTAVGAFTGALPAIAAMRAASAIKDVTTGVMDVMEGAKSLASTAVEATPIGAALGPIRGVAVGALKGPEEAGKAIAGSVGGTMGSMFGSTLAGSLTSNPYGSLIGATAGGIAGKIGLQQAVANEYATARPTSFKPSPTKTSGANVEETLKSPLVASRAASAKLMEQEADPTKYIRELNLPFYGSSYVTNQYGIPNTMIGV